MRYVFNYCEVEGYLFRAPRPVAALICRVADRFGRTWDHGTWGAGRLMRRYQRPLTAVFCAALVIALGVPAVAVFVVSGLAITAIVIRRGGTQ